MLLGFRVHTGWATAVALSGPGLDLHVLFRSRIQLLDEGEGVSRFVYHDAAATGMPAAEEKVRRVEMLAGKATMSAVAGLIAKVREAGGNVRRAGVPGSAKAVPKDLDKILAAHPLIHLAEGKLYRDAIMAALESCGVEPVLMPERDVFARAAAVSQVTEIELMQALQNAAKRLGPPWGQEQRIAAAAALAAGI